MGKKREQDELTTLRDRVERLEIEIGLLKDLRPVCGRLGKRAPLDCVSKEFTGCQIGGEVE